MCTYSICCSSICWHLLVNWVLADISADSHPTFQTSIGWHVNWQWLPLHLLMSCQYFTDTLPILYLCQYLYTFILDSTLQWKWKEKNMSMYILVQYFQQHNGILGDRKYYLACGLGVVLTELASRCTRREHLLNQMSLMSLSQSELSWAISCNNLQNIYLDADLCTLFVHYLYSTLCSWMIMVDAQWSDTCSARDPEFLEILNKLTNFVAWNLCRADFYLRVINIFYFFLMWNC